MRKRKIVGDYKVELESIAKGTYGTIHLAYFGEEERIAKKIEKNEKTTSVFFKEFNLLTSLKSNYIVRFYQGIMTQNNYYLILEKCEGDLRQKLKGPLPEDQAVHVLSCLVAGFIELVTHGIMHRDLKPENILFKG
jgi:serine/threonine protein kinase